jgi:hypothetical protein
MRAAGVPDREIQRAAVEAATEVCFLGGNIVVSSADYGRNLILQKLTGDDTYTLHITHFEVGDGATPVTAADTAMESGKARQPLTSSVIDNDEATLNFFFSDAQLPNDDYTEAGTFVDGTASLGTGKLFNHALFGSTYTKATGEDSTFVVVFTLNAA